MSKVIYIIAWFFMWVHRVRRFVTKAFLLSLLMIPVMFVLPFVALAVMLFLHFFFGVDFNT